MNITLTPDPPPRNSRWHKRIVTITPIPNTRTGNTLELECGHVVQSFGNLGRVDGVVRCDRCEAGERVMSAGV
jgi:hypothetical protein